MLEGELSSRVQSHRKSSSSAYRSTLLDIVFPHRMPWQTVLSSLHPLTSCELQSVVDSVETFIHSVFQFVPFENLYNLLLYFFNGCQECELYSLPIANKHLLLPLICYDTFRYITVLLFGSVVITLVVNVVTR